MWSRKKESFSKKKYKRRLNRAKEKVKEAKQKRRIDFHEEVKELYKNKRRVLWSRFKETKGNKPTEIRIVKYKITKSQQRKKFW